MVVVWYKYLDVIYSKQLLLPPGTVEKEKYNSPQYPQVTKISAVNTVRKELIIICEHMKKYQMRIYDLETLNLKYTIILSVCLQMEYVNREMFVPSGIAVDETRPNEAILALGFGSMKTITKIPIGNFKDYSIRSINWKVSVDTADVGGSDFCNSLSCDDEGRVYSIFKINGKSDQIGIFDFDSGALLGCFDLNFPKRGFWLGTFKVTKHYLFIHVKEMEGFSSIRAYHKNFPKDNQFYTRENSLTYYRYFDACDARCCSYPISHIIQVDEYKFIARSDYEINEFPGIKYSHSTSSLLHFDRKRGELYTALSNTITIYKYPPRYENKRLGRKLFKSLVDSNLVDICFVKTFSKKKM